jgi:RNA polymerase sigma factor (sigma-70 family)
MQEQRDRILTDLFRSKDLANCIAKMEHRHLHDELKSELFLVLSALPYEKVIEMKEQGYLNFYVFRTIANMINSNTSRFYKVFRQSGLNSYPVEYCGHSTAETPEALELRKEAELREEQDLEDMDKVISGMHWYHAEILKLYLKENSIRKVAKKLDIPASSIHETVTKCKEIIRKRLG